MWFLVLLKYYAFTFLSNLYAPPCPLPMSTQCPKTLTSRFPISSMSPSYVPDFPSYVPLYPMPLSPLLSNPYVLCLFLSPMSSTYSPISYVPMSSPMLPMYHVPLCLIICLSMSPLCPFPIPIFYVPMSSPMLPMYHVPLCLIICTSMSHLCPFPIPNIPSVYSPCVLLCPFSNVSPMAFPCVPPYVPLCAPCPLPCLPHVPIWSVKAPHQPTNQRWCTTKHNLHMLMLSTMPNHICRIRMVSFT